MEMTEKDHYGDSDLSEGFFDAEEKKIVECLEKSDYKALENLEKKSVDKVAFGKKIFNFWKAMRLTEMDQVLDHNILASIVIKLKDNFIEVKELLENKKGIVTCTAPKVKATRFLREDRKDQMYKEISFGHFAIKVQKNECCFYLKRLVKNLEVKTQQVPEKEDGDIEKVLVKAKNTKAQSLFLGAGSYLVEADGKNFFIEVLG